MKQEEYDNQIKDIVLAQETYKAQGYAQSLGQNFPISSDTSLVKEQLSLGEELELLDNLLRSYTLIKDEKTGKTSWVKPTNEDLIILSDYGIHTFRQIISAYINKNTLLSNYDEDTILTKMYDISVAINDEIFLNYEKIFEMPSLKRCKEEIDKEISDRLEIRKYAKELLGFNFENETERKTIINEIEYELENKIEKVRNKLFKSKLKRFNLLLRFIQDIIHSAYNRALGGQERRSIRQHMNITETSGGFNMPTQQKKSILNIFKK